MMVSDKRLEQIEKRLAAPMDSTDGMTDWLMHSHRDMRDLLVAVRSLSVAYNECHAERSSLRALMDRIAHALVTHEGAAGWDKWVELPAVAAGLHSRIAILRSAYHETRRTLIQALDEQRTDVCVDCGVVWPKCRCPSGRWWRRSEALLERDDDGRAAKKDRAAG